MTSFIMTNLQGILMGAAVIGIGIASLFGFKRVGELEGEKILLYDRKRAKWPLSVALVGLLLASTMAFVPRGYVGVIYDWSGGIDQQERPEGLNFVIPLKQHVTNVDVRVKAWVFNNENVYVHTQDLQEIRVPFAVNYRINPEEAAHVLQSVAGDPAETILSHAALTSIRDEVGARKLDSLAQDVTEMAEAVAREITPQAERNGLIVQFVAIEDSVIDKAYIEAVKAERISERNIRTAANNVKVAANEARAEAERAEGIRAVGQAQADVAEALAQSVTNDVVQYKLAEQGIRYLPDTLVGDAVDILLGTPIGE